MTAALEMQMNRERSDGTSRNVRACHVVPTYHPHYAAAFEYTRKLAAEGFQVDVLAFARPNEALSETIDGVRVRRVPFVKEKYSFSARNTYYFMSSALQWLAAQRYDLVHVYAFRGCGLLPLLGRNLPSRWLLDIRTGNVSSSYFRSVLADLVTRAESRTFDACIVLDQNVGVKVLGKRRPFHVVPIGADMEKFRPNRQPQLRRALGFTDDRLVVVFSSSMVRPRLPERVLEGFAQAVRRCPQLGLLMVGDGAVGILDELRARASELNIAAHVHFTGYVPYASVQDYITAGDIGLGYVPITPQFDKQPPLKTAEFLACGLPTLATRTAGNALYIRDQENGLLIGDTSEAIAEGLVRLAENPALRERLTSMARASIAEYDWNRIVRDRLLPVYDSLVGAGSEREHRRV